MSANLTEAATNAPPTALIEKINGKVWNLPVGESEVTAVQEKFRVTNIVRDESDPSRVLLRILNDTAPTPNAVTVPPTLEDYYLYLFKSE